MLQCVILVATAAQQPLGAVCCSVLQRSAVCLVANRFCRICYWHKFSEILQILVSDENVLTKKFYKISETVKFSTNVSESVCVDTHSQKQASE